MDVMVTGAGGFVGERLATRLAGDGHRVHGVGLRPLSSEGSALATYMSLDVTAAGALAEVVERIRPAELYHLAGINVGEPRRVLEVNVLGCANVLEAVRLAAPGCRVLVVGSAAEYGTPHGSVPVPEEHPCTPRSPYGIGKYAATSLTLNYVRRFGVDARVVRPFNIVGPGIPRTLLLGALLERAVLALAGPEPPVVFMGNLETYRDFVSLDDAVEGCILAMRRGLQGEVYNICSGRATRVGDLVDLVLSHSDRPVGVEVDPDLVRSDDVEVFVGSGLKAEKALGFRPASSLEMVLKAAWERASRGLTSPS